MSASIFKPASQKESMAGKTAGNFRKNFGKSVKEARSLNWRDIIVKSLTFSFFPKRWAPFFILDMGVLLTVFMLMGNLSMDALLLEESILTAETLSTMGWALLVMTAWVLLGLWFIGALIHQSWKPKEFMQSWKAALKRYPSLLAAFAVTSIVSFLLSLVPYLGIIFSLIIAMAFLLVFQFVVVGGQGFYNAIGGSVRAFRERTFTVIVAFLLNTVLAMAIVGIFAIPTIAIYLYYSLDVGAEMAATYMIYLMDRSVLAVVGSILMVGFSISKVFGLKLLTETYLKMTKKRFIPF
jgi:hypothetical protein